MRILNIYYKNINSLEGEGRIYFDQGPIADSGVFAITGPNGSGKTSILDVITLALYGETFRFDKPAAHIITKHTDESLAQVEFAFGAETYRSSWQVQRDAADRPDMMLTRLNGTEEMLAETPFQVRSFLADLTGMDFHKFTKSMVLPQGDFAAFLHALDSERLDILEKIGGTDLYTDYRRQVESRHAELQAKVALLEQDTSLLPILSDEALEAAALDLQDFQELSAELKQEQQQLQQQLLNLENIAALKQQQARLDKQQQNLADQLAAHQADLQRLAAAPHLDLYQDDLQLLETMLAETEDSRTRLSQSRLELSQLQQQLAADSELASAVADAEGKTLVDQKQLIDTLKLSISDIKLDLPRQKELSQSIQQQLAEKQASIAEVESWLQAHQADAILLTDFPDVVQLRNLRSELQSMLSQQKTQSAWSKRMTSVMQKNKSALAAAETRLQDLLTQISTDQQTIIEISQAKSFDELKVLQQDQESRFKDIQNLFELASINARLDQKKGFFSWFDNKKVVEVADEAQLQSRLNALKLEIASEENIAYALEQAISNEALLKRLQPYRTKLVDGKPCFLCGATHHPYEIKPPIVTDSKKALADQRGKLQFLKVSIESAEKQLAASQNHNTRLSAKQKFLQEKRSEWIFLANKMNVAREGLSIEHVSRHKELLTAEADDLEKIKNLVNQHAGLQRNIASAKNEIEDKQAEIEKLRAYVEQLDAEWAAQAPEAQEFEQKYTETQTAEKALIVRLEQQLSLLGEKMPNKGKENVVFDRLNSRRQDYQIYELRQTGLQTDTKDLQEKLQVCQTTILAYQEQLSANLASLSREEWLGLHLAVLEKQQLILKQEQQLQEQDRALSGMRRAVTEKISEHGFSSLEQLLELCKLRDRQLDIQQTIADLNAKSAALTVEANQLKQQLTAALLVTDDSIAATDVHSTINSISEKLEIAKLEMHSLQTKLDKQQQYRLQQQRLETELEQMRRLLLESTTEISIINDEQGGLRRKVQQLLIDKLIANTNRILEKISGRYYLRSAVSEHGLALEIEDSKQQNVRRLPKTLSGGESFILSLALALALAEIGNKGKAIESLFLDEGFGNLDAEALYLAMSALESLKIQGKTVGIISHVEAVKKRIKTQIELVKKANGLSELKLVA